MTYSHVHARFDTCTNSRFSPDVSSTYSPVSAPTMMYTLGSRPSWREVQLAAQSTLRGHPAKTFDSTNDDAAEAGSGLDAAALRRASA